MFCLKSLFVAGRSNAPRKTHIKTLCNLTRKLRGSRRTTDSPIRGLLSKLNSHLEEGHNQFAAILNSDPTVDPLEPQTDQHLPIKTHSITKEEVKRPVPRLRSGKAAGSDKIPPESF